MISLLSLFRIAPALRVASKKGPATSILLNFCDIEVAVRFYRRKFCLMATKLTGITMKSLVTGG